MDRLAALEALRQADVLRHLPLGALDRLASGGRMRRFRPGEELFAEGSAGEEVWILLEGQVSIRLALSEAEQRAIATRHAGELVGEMALVDDLPRSASVIAEGRGRALSIARGAFLEAVGSHPRAARELMRVLSVRLRESDAAQIEALRAKAERLADSNHRLSRENRRLRVALDQRFGFEAFVGGSAAAENVRVAARRAAENDLPVLLVGETGTGKELLARAIHAASERGGRPLVALNCALFSEALLESELFGHARGAFTGAVGLKPGLVEAADGGTLFLDELVDMPRPIQAALLRFLELGEFRRLGETELRHADVRIVAATHDVEAAIESGQLRRDLAFRLDVFRIPLPALRERRDDIAELVTHIAEDVAKRLGRTPLAFSQDALEALSRYDFPGNVRELRNVVERIFAMRGTSGSVEPSELSPRIRAREAPTARGYSTAVRAFKQQLIRDALVRADGSRSAAARALGVHPTNLMRMIRELEIDVPAARGAERDARATLPGRSS
jgi:transcriptional regulator with PAS, ATPase and Fis domain